MKQTHKLVIVAIVATSLIVIYMLATSLGGFAQRVGASNGAITPVAWIYLPYAGKNEASTSEPTQTPTPMPEDSPYVASNYRIEYQEILGSDIYEVWGEVVNGSEQAIDLSETKVYLKITIDETPFTFAQTVTLGDDEYPIDPLQPGNKACFYFVFHDDFDNEPEIEVLKVDSYEIYDGEPLDIVIYGTKWIGETFEEKMVGYAYNFGNRKSRVKVLGTAYSEGTGKVAECHAPSRDPGVDYIAQFYASPELPEEWTFLVDEDIESYQFTVIAYPLPLPPGVTP